jgi:hypothetical protein
MTTKRIPQPTAPALRLVNSSSWFTSLVKEFLVDTKFSNVRVWIVGTNDKGSEDGFSTGRDQGGFYTHITNVPPSLGVLSRVSRGDLLGTVHSVRGTPAHLHLALVEIIGALPGAQYTGVNLYQLFLDTTNTTNLIYVTFNQDGSPPGVCG